MPKASEMLHYLNIIIVLSRMEMHSRGDIEIHGAVAVTGSLPRAGPGCVLACCAEQNVQIDQQFLEALGVSYFDRTIDRVAALSLPQIMWDTAVLTLLALQSSMSLFG